MAPRLAAPVLTVDARKMHQIDTRNVENLHSMWTVFHRCADAVEEGRRLENLSWRIWNRETFCCEHGSLDVADIDRTRLQPRHQSSRDLPQLSSSVDSAASSDDLESRMTRNRQYSPPLAIHRLDSSRSSLSGLGSSARERHISSIALERMVTSIKERKNPKEALPAHVIDAIPAVTASAPAPSAMFVHPLSKEAAMTSLASRRCDDARSSRSSDSTAPLSSASSRGSRRMDSDTSAESMLLSKRGDCLAAYTTALAQPSSCLSSSASQVLPRADPRATSSTTSTTATATVAPIPAKNVTAENNNNNKKGMFFLTGSKSSGEDEYSLEQSMRSSDRLLVPQKSSLTSQFKRAANNTPKKTTSFKDVVQERTFTDEDVFEDSSDDEEGDEDEEEDDVGGAIEDDSDSDVIDEEDDAEWESGSDSEAEDDKPAAFPRVDSRHNLTSRTSLLTTMMHQSDRATAMQELASQQQQQQLHASRSQPQLPRTGRTRMTSSPLSGASNTTNNINAHEQFTRPVEQKTAPKPIMMSPPSSTALALSPKTTRRNMFAAELTESLRTHLLHERAMKNNTLAASKKALIRRHTAQGNLSQLTEYPRAGRDGKGMLSTEKLDEAVPWHKSPFEQDGLGEYHESGW